MYFSTAQKINMLAIEILEDYGNEQPTQAQIDSVERFILKNRDVNRVGQKSNHVARHHA